MIFLSQGQVLNGAKPLLEVFFQRGGYLIDVYSLAFEIWKTPGSGAPSQVGTRTAVNVGTTYPTALAGRLSTGRYFATWTVPTVGGQAAHEIRWFYRLTSSDDEVTVAVPFEVLTCPIIAQRGLCSVASMRADGVTLEAASDFRCHQAIVQATAFIERVCRRWFYPAFRSFTVSSSGAALLLLPAPIVGISTVKVAYDNAFDVAEPLDGGSFRVYASHLSEEMTVGADDRNNPKLERVHNLDFQTWRGRGLEHWPVGERHIQITGAFGYTEPDGATGGKTPELIRLACMKLASRYAAKKSGGSAASSAESAPPVGPVKRLKTKQNEVEFSEAAASASLPSGMISGDADVDGILELFIGPPAMGTW